NVEHPGGIPCTPLVHGLLVATDKPGMAAVSLKMTGGLICGIESGELSNNWTVLWEEGGSG
ncbi:MAG: hypothetical protein QM840_07150, partial [Verrucomicrobiota bacterium]|nr:hypothetical protein [Verrucomicrobiota bacterium]